MRSMFVLCLVASLAIFAAGKKPIPPATPKTGVKTPGVQILITNLKPEEQVDAKPDALGVGDLAQSVAGLSKPCGGTAIAFGSLWAPDCETQVLFRIDVKKDPKKFEVTAKVETGVAAGAQTIASSTDSIWLFSDSKTTLTRIDPDLNRVVAEIRLQPGCAALAFGETALWAACPGEDRVIRVNPQTNLVEKRIEVSARPSAIAIGEGSVWVLCEKDGKVDRIDPKANKVTKSIELQVPQVNGGIAVGLGSVWVTMEGFPLTRIDPASEKVMQQFWGAGGGAIQVVGNSLWLSNLKERTLWRIDPKRVLATLAE